MFRWLQNYPHLLEILWQFFEIGLSPLKRLFNPGGFFEPAILAIEKAGKRTVFNCQMCGQCVLHSTGMTCPMNCPKNLRNGPCGGVRLDGNCEVYPGRRCVWVEAWNGSRKMKAGDRILNLQQPVNHSQRGSSSWLRVIRRIAESKRQAAEGPQ